MVKGLSGFWGRRVENKVLGGISSGKIYHLRWGGVGWCFVLVRNS